MCSVRVNLEPDEFDLLVRGLLQWSGPANPSDAVAALLGWRDGPTMATEIRRIADKIEASQDLPPRDWHRALNATEIVFASDRYGAGVEWETCTGLGDAHTVEVLRRLQRKFICVS
jgi:hypothetical protein